MGAWGHGIYENDDAVDFAAEIADGGLAAVESALDAVLDADYVEAPDGSCALVAADVVARLVSGSGEDSSYAEAVAEWVRENAGSPSPSLVDKAKRVVGLVRGDASELAELWAESGSSQAGWLTAVAELEARLA
jgi:hypothetical protein